MKTRRTSHRNHRNDLSDDALCQLAIAHDRYTVSFHVTTCQMWVIDSTGQDKPRGPFLASRQAWAEAHELNQTNTLTTAAGSGRRHLNRTETGR